MMNQQSLIALTAALAGGEADARIKSSLKTLSINLIDDDDTAVTWSTGGTVTEGTDSFCCFNGNS